MNVSPYIPLREYPSTPDLEMRVRIILGRGIFERSSFKKLMRHTSPRDIAVDVGAHVGSWTLGFSKLFGSVIGFEPHKKNRAYLEENIKRAAVTNVVIYPFAITNDIRQKFCITACNATRNSGGMYLIPLNGHTRNASPVECIRLDDTMERIPQSRRINALKVDVEGMELNVIKSGTALIREHKPTILLEVREHSLRYGDTPEAVFDHMSDIGYRPVDRYRHDYVFRPKDV